MIGLSMICSVIFVGFISKIFPRKNESKNLPEYSLHFCIPFSTAIILGTEDTTREYNRLWGKKISCKRQSSPDSAAKGNATYIVENGRYSLRLVASQSSLSPNLVDVVMNGDPSLDEPDIVNLKNNKGYITLDYIGSPDSPKEKAAFCTELLVSLLEKQGALGYVNIPAQLYRPKTGEKTSFQNSVLEEGDLFFLLINIHSVDMEKNFWLHTHGMEQFGCPDLQLYFEDDTKYEYYKTLISVTAIYMIDSGPVLKTGDTFQMPDDDNFYKIYPVKPIPDHSFGRCGAIELKSTNQRNEGLYEPQHRD